MTWELLDPIITIDGDARTFVVRGRLPLELASAQCRSSETATEIWRGTTFVGDEYTLPDHVFVVKWAEFRLPDELTLMGAVEGPRPK